MRLIGSTGSLEGIFGVVASLQQCSRAAGVSLHIGAFHCLVLCGWPEATSTAALVELCTSGTWLLQPWRFTQLQLSLMVGCRLTRRCRAGVAPVQEDG